jgi:nitroreductase
MKGKSMIANETLRIIKQRRSIRSYKDQQIKDEELSVMLEAGQYAPNAGDQAWHFTVVQNKDLLHRLNNAAKEAARNLDIAGLKELGQNVNFNCLYGAPTLIIVSGSEQSPVPLEADCAAATENLLIAAESVGLGSCWVFFVLLAFTSPQSAELKKELKIPEGYKPFSSAVFGYKKGEAPKAPERKCNLVTFLK